MKKYIWIMPFFILLAGCAPSRFVQPLEEKEHSVGFELGGPMFNYSGLVIPAPLSGFYYGYGFKEDLTLYGGLHFTSLLFENYHFDVGATYKIMGQNQYLPSLSISPSAMFIFRYDVKPKMWPQLDVNAYWELGNNNSYFYAGMSNIFELSPTRAHEEESLDRWLLNPQIGYVFKTEKWDFSFECKFIAPTHENTYVLVDYKSITGKYGSTGIYLGVARRF